MTTSMEVGAALASAILIKGSIVAASALLLARLAARTAARASLALGLGLGALGLVVLLGPLAPDLNSGFLTISHGALEGPAIGSLTLSPALVLVVIWAIGVLVMLGRLNRDFSAAIALAQRASGQTGKRARHLIQEAARRVGLSRLPEFRETKELSTAALIGFRRPVLLIPIQAREWSDEELFGVLCHELEHLRRGDWLMLMIERVIVAIYWLNPLVHVLTRQASAMRECAADDAAMRAGAGASAYAGRLILVARELKRAPRLAVSVAFADGGRVDQRVRALFETRDRHAVTRITTLRAALLTIPLVLILAAVEPWTCLPGATAGGTTGICP